MSPTSNARGSIARTGPGTTSATRRERNCGLPGANLKARLDAQWIHERIDSVSIPSSSHAHGRGAATVPQPPHLAAPLGATELHRASPVFTHAHQPWAHASGRAVGRA